MARSELLAPVIAGALLLWSTPVSATVQLEGHGPLAGGTLSISDRFALRYYSVDQTLPGFEDSHPNLHDYVEEVNRINLLLNKGGFAAGAQIDQVGLFANRYYLDDQLNHSYELYEPDIRSPWPDAYLGLEKVYLRNKGEHLEVNLGDGYVSFGRGIALNLVRNTNIDLDSSLRGVRAVVRAGNWDFTGVSGLTNPQQVQLDNRNVGIHSDNQHMVSGVRAERFGLGAFNVGAHGVVYSFARRADDASPGFTDPTGVCPVELIICGFDPLRDEAQAYQRKLEAAGVPVHTVFLPGQIHGWLQGLGVLDVARHAWDDLAKRVGLALAQPAGSIPRPHPGDADEP